MSNLSKARAKAKKLGKELTEEEKAAFLLAAQKRLEEQQKEQERLTIYGKSVTDMSHAQLSGELTRMTKREYSGRPPEPQPGLTIAFATVLGIVLKNTRTTEVFEVDSKNRPTRVARLDQINKLGTLYPYPR